MAKNRDLGEFINDVVHAYNVVEDPENPAGIYLVLYVGRTWREAQRAGIAWKGELDDNVPAESSEMEKAVERQLRAHSGSGKAWLKWYRTGHTNPAGTVSLPLGLDASNEPLTASEATSSWIGVMTAGMEMMISANQEMMGRVIEMTGVASEHAARAVVAETLRDSEQTNDFETAMPLLRDLAQMLGSGVANAPEDPGERAAFAVGSMEAAAATLASAIRAGGIDVLTDSLKDRLVRLVQAATSAAAG